MGSINGLKNIHATSIQNAGQFYLGNNLDSGAAGQVIISAGPQQAALWGSNSATLPGALTMGTNLSLASGDASFDGTTADTINATGLSITGGNGISVVGGTEILTDNDNTTINNSGGTGQQNQVLKVPNALTINSTTYDGSVARNFTLATTDTTYQGSSTINIDTSTNPDTINALKVPNALTINSTTYDGSVARNFTLATTDTTYTVADPITLSAGNEIGLEIDGNTIFLDGAELAVAKVPNVMTAGSNISMVVTADGSSATTYDGSDGITINSTDTDTVYQGGTNISIDTSTTPDSINLDDNIGLTQINPLTLLVFNQTGITTAIIGSAYPNKPTLVSYLDLSDSSNIMPHPSGVFDVGGDLRMTINLSNFMPNDDSSLYNIAVEDDFSSLIMGTIKPMNSSLEVCGYFVIPEGYTATAIRIDLNNASGTPVGRAVQVYSVTTYGGTGYSTLSTFLTGSQSTLANSMVGASDTIMLIKIYTSSTADFIRGGYIKLTRN